MAGAEVPRTVVLVVWREARGRPLHPPSPLSRLDPLSLVTGGLVSLAFHVRQADIQLEGCIDSFVCYVHRCRGPTRPLSLLDSQTTRANRQD